MISSDRINMVAPCGIDCGLCELHICKDDEKLKQSLIAQGAPEEKLPCNGCRNIKGLCMVINGECKTYSCVVDHKVNFCYECSSFPCNKLHPSSDRANILPHNMKIFNLCSIKRDGVKKFIENSPENKKRYYTGKMDIGNGPQLSE